LSVLHFSPEQGLREVFEAQKNLRYATSWHEKNRAADFHLDLTALDLPDNSWDVLIAYHILEHIPDDRKAMREMYRVLEPGGWAVLQVPVASSPARSRIPPSTQTRSGTRSSARTTTCGCMAGSQTGRMSARNGDRSNSRIIGVAHNRSVAPVREREWMAQWRRAAPALEQVRARELASLRPADALAAAEALLTIAARMPLPPQRRTWSGLVVLQRRLHRLA
jgi:SAM-dependent methyltransferase